MAPKRPPLCDTLIAALSLPIQASINELVEGYGWDESDPLSLLEDVRIVLDAWGLECEPKIGLFDLDEPRVFRAIKSDGIEGVIADEIMRGESDGIEYKETLLLDVRKFKNSGLPIRECASEDVLFSTLKTIAAFLNTKGGALLVGVSDNGEIAGVEVEFPIIPGARKFDLDEWELFLRSKIETSFHNGRRVNASVLISSALLEGKRVVRVEVGQRRELCVLKFKDQDFLFVRIGNRTTSVKISELEGFFEIRKTYL